VYIVAECRKFVRKLSILRQTIKYLLLPGNHTKENMMFDKDVLCQTVYEFYDKGKYPTASKLRKIMEEKIGFSGS
jgi:hypothetical protein